MVTFSVRIHKNLHILPKLVLFLFYNFRADSLQLLLLATDSAFASASR